MKIMQRNIPTSLSISIDTTAIPHWAWLLLIAVPLRFIGLGRESLWYDETFTLWIAKLPWDRFWLAIRGDVHPPGWYLIEKAVVSVFGGSEVALRLPSAVFGVIAVLLVWRIALALKFDRSTAFVAGMLTAMLPAALYYSQDARMYPLLLVGVLLMVLSAIKERWAWFAVGGIVTVYAQNLGVFYVLAIGFGALYFGAMKASITYSIMQFDPPLELEANKPYKLLFKPGEINQVKVSNRAAIIGPVLALVAIILVWLPWAWWGEFHQAQNIANGFWLYPLTPGGFLFAMPQITMGIRASDAVQIHLYGVSLGLTLIGVIVCREWLTTTRAGILLFTASLFIPVALAIISVEWRSVFLPRAMLPAGVLLMPIWAYTLMHLSPPNKRIALAIFIPTLLIGVVANYFPADGRVDIREWANPIIQQWQLGDVVYHISIDSDITLSAYTSTPAYLLPESNDLTQSLTDETKAAMGLQQVPFDDLRAWAISAPGCSTPIALWKR
jgi:4-amino-4-deoxy-L-arabinose transferase-like glycosyltransferase